MGNIEQGKLFANDELIKEFRSRSRDYIEDTIQLETPVPEGWTPRKALKKKLRITRSKDIATLLEDKVWRLFYSIGIKRISSRDYAITIKTREGLDLSKRISLLAVDDNIVFVVDCISQEINGPKKLERYIADYADHDDYIRNAVKVILGTKDLVFVFVIATENIIWDEDDKREARNKRFIVINEYDLLSLQGLADLAGEGAKYQIYSRIFYDRKIKNFEVKVPALMGKMGGHTYYSFVLTPDHLLKIAYVHHRSASFDFLQLSDSYQRMIKKPRIRKIEEYIANGGFFPGNIIVNFTRPFVGKPEPLCEKEKLLKVKQDAKPVVITLPPYYGCAWIIDGQHRLYGFADTKKKTTETVPVLAFVSEPQHVQAKIFKDINVNQKAIEADLLWDLYEDLYFQSTDENEQQLYAISKIAKLLNSKEDSPFKAHINIPKEQNNGNISLTSICASIDQQKLISQKEELLFNRSYEESILFAADRISAFFNVFKKELPDQWNMGERHYLRTNSGIVVLFGILRDIIECNMAKDELINIRSFEKLCNKFLEPLLIYFMDASKDEIESYRAAGGASGKSREYRKLFTKIIVNSNIGFRSRWLEKYENAQEEEDKDRLEKRKKGILFYLEREESNNLEFKGSMLLSLNRLIKGDGIREDDEKILEDGILKTIVAFLNSNGGELIIGVLEKNQYEKEYENKLSEYPIVKEKVIFGIDNEYGKDKWDGYLRRLIGFIESRIGADNLDSGLIDIDKLIYEKERDLCLISVKPAGSKQYLNKNKFYIRRHNKTVLLEGKEIDNYWANR